MDTSLSQPSTQDPQPQRIVIGNAANSWTWTPSGWDLTHSSETSSSNALNARKITLPCETSNIVIDPQKTALLIIDMQNINLDSFFSSPLSQVHSAESSILKYALPAARKLFLQVIWLNWGLTESQLANMHPSEIRNFGFAPRTSAPDFGFGERDRHRDGSDPANFVKCGDGVNPPRIPGAQLGMVRLEDGSEIDAGRFLMRGAWNAALHGRLAEAYDSGKTVQRADVLIHKSANSGFAPHNTDLHTFLQKEGIRTLLFSGINTDQCVGSTLMNAFARGYDTVLLKDGCGTDSMGGGGGGCGGAGEEKGEEMVKRVWEWNCAWAWGFASSCRALAGAVGL